MKILHRYIFSELISPFFMGLFVFTFVMLTNAIIKLMDLLFTKGVNFLTAFKLLILSTPYILVLTIPMSVLLAVLITFSRLSADSEITAMKASGVSANWMMKPVLAFALVAYILNSALYIGFLPKSNLMLKQLQFDIIRSRANIGIKPHIFITDFIPLVIYVNDISNETSAMEGIFIADNRNFEQPLVITAENGHKVVDKNSNSVTLRLIDGCTHELFESNLKRYSITPFEQMDLNLNIDLFDQKTVSKSDREMTISELIQKIQRQNKSNKNAARQWVELWKKAALPFACIIFAVIGVPLGITTRRGGRSAAFATSIGLILIYYILLTGGTGLAEENRLSPFLATWLPNICLSILAFFLYLRMLRESPPGFISKITDTIIFFFYQRKQKLRSTSRQEAPFRPRYWRFQLGRILDRYISTHFSKLFFYIFVALLGISLIVHAFEKIERLVEWNANLIDSIIAVGFRLPYFGYLVIPFATLVATILTIGVFNRSSELIAMKSCGISYFRIVLPLITLGLLLSIFTFFLGETIVPRCNQQVEYAWDRIKQRERTRFVHYHKWYRGRTGDVYYFRHFDSDKNAISGFSKFKLDDNMNIIERLESEEVMWNDENWTGDKVRKIQMEKSCTLISDQIQSNTTINIPETPQDFSKEYKDSEEMNISELKEYIEILKSIGFETREYEVDLHAKFSIPFLSIIMVIIGVAFASQNPRASSGLVGIGTSIILGAIYFIIFRISLELGQANKMPAFMSAWTCNIVFTILGIWLLIKNSTSV